jgi:sugar phosphate isomerase/epimerase
MNINRHEFLAGGLAASLASVVRANSSCCLDGACRAPTTACGGQKGGAKLNLCLQWPSIPVADDFNAKLDYLEQNGYGAVEIPTGKKGEWVLEKGEAFAKAMKGRRLFCATACGPSRFDYADPAANDAEVAKFMPVLEVLGAIGSVGLIICPARAKPEVGLKELREDFVTNTGKRLAEKAAKCGTAIVLEPLQRKETPFLRQVSDGAKMAQEIGPGCKVMADLWHMTWEEANDRAAILAAGDLLAHVHIASRRTRKIPGSDGAADDYRLAFKGLKEIGYGGVVSLEAGWVPKGKDAKGKDILPDLPERHQILMRMCALLRAQWAEA